MCLLNYIRLVCNLRNNRGTCCNKNTAFSILPCLLLRLHLRRSLQRPRGNPFPRRQDPHGLRTELTFFHTFTDVPVNKGTLGVHKIELVVKTSGQLTDGGGVGDHEEGTLNLGQVTSWNNSWWLVVDGTLNAVGHQSTNWMVRLDLTARWSVDVFGDDITTVHEDARHVLSVARVALNHHGGWLEDGGGDFRDGELFVVRFLGGDDGCVRAQVGTEFVGMVPRLVWNAVMSTLI